jgi:hypothetical protein
MDEPGAPIWTVVAPYEEKLDKASLEVVDATVIMLGKLYFAG